MANFKIGDKVKIRTWESMKKEFGTDRAGDISCKCRFFTDMRKYCGKVFTIKEVLCGDTYRLSGVNVWKFSEDMFEDNVVKFKVGDKVIAKNGAPYSITTNGWKGVARTAENDAGFMCVAGDKFFGPAGVVVESKYFDLDKSCCQKIVITTDGKTTTAVLYDGKQRIKDAKAMCAPDDEFDLALGAMLAIERLLENPDATIDEKTFDWDKFKAGKIAVKVTKDNFENFVTEAKKHKLTFKPDENFNPFDTVVDKFFRQVIPHVDVKENEIYVTCEDGALKIGHYLKDTEEFVW